MKFLVWIVIKRYVGERSLSIYKRIYEHRKYLKGADISDSLVKHNLETNYNSILKIPRC